MVEAELRHPIEALQERLVFTDHAVVQTRAEDQHVSPCKRHGEHSVQAEGVNESVCSIGRARGVGTFKYVVGASHYGQRFGKSLDDNERDSGKTVVTRAHNDNTREAVRSVIDDFVRAMAQDPQPLELAPLMRNPRRGTARERTSTRTRRTDGSHCDGGWRPPASGWIVHLRCDSNRNKCEGLMVDGAATSDISEKTIPSERIEKGRERPCAHPSDQRRDVHSTLGSTSVTVKVGHGRHHLGCFQVAPTESGSQRLRSDPEHHVMTDDPI